MSGIDLIRRERARQRKRQGDGEAYSLSHDDEHDEAELARAASVYAMPHRYRKDYGWALWPMGWRFKDTPNDRIGELVKAGALIAAEIDRLERAARGRDERG